jgi:hypothetical protein
VFLTLALFSPFGFAAPDSNADLNGDVLVNSLDISKLSSCFGQDPMNNSVCATADADEDGDIDIDDFSFVSARLGQAYDWLLYPSPVFNVGDRPLSTSLGDLNGDSQPDVVVANNTSDEISVLLGTGDGGLHPQRRFDVGSRPFSTSLGDLNGDGNLDVVVANDGSNDISVLLGNGDGSFQQQQRFALGSRPNLIGLGDVNGDDHLDVALNQGVMLGNGDGSLQVVRSYLPDHQTGATALGDVNGDGTLDVVIVGEYGDSSVLLGNGDGSFQEQQTNLDAWWPTSLTLVDINQDGRLDALVVSDYATNGGIRVFLGNGDGNFQSTFGTSTERVLSTTLGDVNGNGHLDLLFITLHQYTLMTTLSVLPGNGDGTFLDSLQEYVANFGEINASADLNEDGRLDLIVTESTTGDITVLQGKGDGSFFHEHQIAVGTIYHSTPGDWNGDGQLDLVLDGQVLLGNGDGSFQGQSIDLYCDPIQKNLVDVNRDGSPDMVCADSYSNSFSVWLNDGNGGVQSREQFTVGDSPLLSVSLGDINEDGSLDVVAVNENSNDISVLLGHGDGSFQEQYPIAAVDNPTTIVLGDINQDDSLDIVAGSSNGNDILALLGNGDGSFQEQYRIADGNNPNSVVLSDINRDDRLDLFFADSLDNNISILLGNGDGSFQDQRSLAACESPYNRAPLGDVKILGDVNGDGTLDIVVACTDRYFDVNSVMESTSSFSVMLGHGDGSFHDQQRFHIQNNLIYLHLGDLNGDTRLDLISTHVEGGMTGIIRYRKYRRPLLTEGHYH